MVSYYGEYLAHRSPIAGNWWANALTNFRGGGHLTLDLLEHRVPLRFLIQRLSNQLNGPPPGDDEPDDGDEDGDGGDDGPGPGPGGRRRKRSRNGAGFGAARDLLRASVAGAHREDAAVGAIGPEDHVGQGLMAAGPSNA